MKRPTVKQIGEAGVFISQSRPAIGCAGVIALVILLLAGSCYTRQRGVLEERVRQYQSQANAHKKAVEVLLKVVDSKDSIIKAQAGNVGKTKTVYRTLRDSLVITDTVMVRASLDAADSAIASQDSLIETQASQITTLKLVVSEQGEQIKSLNRVIATQTGAIKSARRGGVVKGIKIGAAVGAAAVWVLK